MIQWIAATLCKQEEVTAKLEIAISASLKGL